MIKCFMTTPTDRCRQYLRRYSSSDTCSGPMSYHNADIRIEDGTITVDERGYYHGDEEAPSHDDPRWPTYCCCGYEFKDTDTWQLKISRINIRMDTGEDCVIGGQETPHGAMWDAYWRHGTTDVGPDGLSLCVMTPGGEWCIDAQAPNCTRPDDHVHKCWVRHGTPPEITVDKNGDTCAAGAGSILSGSYHGFLRGGFLVEC